MTDGYEAAHDAVAWTRPDVGVLRVTGEDARDFLDRTVTADVDASDEPKHALFLDPEGKTRDSLRIVPQEDGFLVVSRRPDETADEWRSNIFVEDVEVDNADVSVVSLQGPDAADAVPEDATAYETRRSPSGGFDVIADGFTPDAPRYDDYAEALRVEAGVAGFENELEGRVPVGARLDIFSEEKCYVGQEVVARIRQRGGGPSRLLAPLEDVPEEAETGDTVRYDGRAAGELTTVTESPRHGRTALGYVEADAIGEKVEVGGDEAQTHEPPLAVPEEEG